MTSVSPPASRWERVREPVLFTVGLAWMLVVEVKNFLPDDGDPYTVWADLIVGLLMQWSGLLVWRRRGTGNLGPWLYLAGILWYVGSGMPEPVGWMTFPFRGWYEPLLVAVVLAYPSGHLVRTADRILVGILVTAYLARTVVRACFFDLGSCTSGNDAPPFPTLIRYDEALWQSVENAVIGVSALVGLAVAVVCVRRWLRASGPARRTLTPVLVSGIAIAPMLGWTALTTPVNSFGLPFLNGIWVVWVQILLRGLVPVAVLLGIVRAERGAVLARRAACSSWTEGCQSAS